MSTTIKINSLLLPSHHNFTSLPTTSFLSLHSTLTPKPITLLSFTQTLPPTHKPPRSLSIPSAFSPLSETSTVTLSDAVNGGDLPSSPGVYAVFDSDGALQFIGLSRDVKASVSSHKSKLSPQLCSSVKVGVVDQPDRESLTQAWKSWMEEHLAATGKIPPGNESGNATWFKPPTQKKSDIRLTPGRHVQLTVPLEELIDKLVKENKVVAFIKGTRSSPMCGFSQKVIGILESVGLDYESIDVLDEEYNYGLRETLKKYSNWPTFPQIFVNGELVGGCDILTSMHEKGEIASLFKN